MGQKLNFILKLDIAKVGVVNCKTIDRNVEFTAYNELDSTNLKSYHHMHSCEYVYIGISSIRRLYL